jgi:hypothetical protein
MPKTQPTPQTHDMPSNPRCPLCGQPAEVYRTKEPPQFFEGHCETCGDICITASAVEKAGSLNQKHLISAWTRRHPDPGPADILVDDDIDLILKDTPDLSVPEKLDRTLGVIAAMTAFPGENSQFRGSHDYPLIYAHGSTEAYFYVRQLANLGYVNHDPPSTMVLAAGYRRLFELQTASRDSTFAFVAMWFDPSMSSVYQNAIAPAIEQAGYRPIRIDREQHVNRIDDEIIGRIRGSRFMVADFTGQRAGVYFEAGFMLGLRRTVIWMCKRDEMAKLHFDTRQYNFIDYPTVADAKKRLYDRILAIEGEGPGATKEA